MKRKKINYQLLLRRVCLIVLDIFLIILSSLMALATRFEFDVRQIPEEFLIPQPPKTDNDAIRKALAKQDLPWAHLEPRGDHLTIK